MNGVALVEEPICSVSKKESLPNDPAEHCGHDDHLQHPHELCQRQFYRKTH